MTKKITTGKNSCGNESFLLKYNPHMSNHAHSCRAIVVTCMDFRLQEMIYKWTKSNFTNGFDRVAVAGGVRNLAFVLEQIETSFKLHHICQVYLINHEDCGAYGEAGNFEKHRKDLLFAKKIIMQKFPSFEIISFYLKLNGEFVRVYSTSDVEDY